MDKARKNQSESPQANALRRKAEQQLRRSRPTEVMPDADVRALVHELQVHQVELEMQNEELRRAQAVAQEASEKYCNLFDFAPTGCFLLDERGEIQEANLAGAALLGRDRSALVKSRFGLFVAPEDRAAFADFCKQVLQAEAKRASEFRLFEGEQTVYALVEGIAAGCDKEKKSCWWAAVVDITTHKRAEEDLRRNETQLRDILDNSTTVVFLKDPQGRYLLINRRYEELFHVGRDAVIGKTDRDIFAAEFAEAFQDTDRRALESGRPIEAEEAVPQDDGIHRYLSIKFPLSGPDGRPYAVCGIATDITERKRAEEALHKSEDLLKATGEVARVGGWELDLATQEVTWTEETCRIHEVDPDYKPHLEEAIGFYPPECIPALREALRKTAETGEPYDLEMEFIPAKTKKRIWTRTIGRVCYRDGKIVKLQGTFQDIDVRKRAEEELRLAHKELRHLLAYCPAVFYTLKLEGRTIIPVMVSDNVERLLGVTPAEVARFEWWTESIHPEDRGRVLSTTAREFARDGCSLEYHLRHRDGTYRWIEDNNRVLRDAAGRPAEVVGVWIDITERKKLQSEVSLREQQLNSFFGGATAGLALLDKDLRYVRVNSTLAEMNGVPVEQHIGRTLREVVPWLAPAVEMMFQEVLTTGEPVLNVEVAGERPSQPGIQRHWMKSFFPIVGADGSPNGVGAIVVEITERKRAEEALRSSEELYRSVVENIDAGIVLIDSNHTLVAVNPAQARMFGRAVDELVGKKCFREFEKRDAVCPHCHGVEAMATGRSVEREREGVRQDGTRFTARAKAFPLFGPDGAVRGFVELVEDITQRKQAEESQQRAKEAAEAASRAKSEFLANMSHEIRTPMTAILGFSDLLASPNLPYKEQRQFLDGIQRNGKALLELISNILDLSRIEADRLTLEKVDCHPRQIIDDVLSVVQVRAEKQGLALEVDYAFPLPETIHTDPARLRQVLVNLVGNAVKFTERGGVRITVRCVRETDGPARVQFAVSDTGIGIPAERIDELFQPFTQVDGSASRRYGGTGLGLAISQRLATALGGKVEVASELGKGSTFTLTIDAGPLEGVRMLQAPPASPAAAQGTPPPLQEMALHGRVLLAEDVPAVHTALAEILRKMDLEVEIAEDGRAACEMAEKSQAEGRPYDLILMDIQMPRMDGYEATHWLRRQGWRGPIVALTAHALVGDREKCLDAGCDDYVAKPIAMTALRSVLLQYLGRAAAAGGGAEGAPQAARDSARLLDGGILDPGRAKALVDAFRGELAARADTLDAAFQQGDRAGLLELAHQLKGTAGIYGFDGMSAAAGTICDRLRTGGDLQGLQAAVFELAGLCRQAASESG